ncbi:MAG: hypothetical protein HQ483_19545 [Rhodospirillales bacterium]|nr:hypothetical protein [Rhodospirillales bacterium]
MTNLSEASPEQLDALMDAGTHILECYRVLQKSSANVVGEVLKGQGDFFEWDHYPTGDVYDHETHSQYYYHAHPPEKRANKWGAEHGHFHTFLRPRGMPDGIAPAPLDDFRAPDDPNDALTHFIGISMNQAGYPIRLFTTNRWVTGEVWYTAQTVTSLLDRFEIDLSYPSWPVNIWLTHMLRLYRFEIIELLAGRDAMVKKWQASHPGVNAYEDRNLEITSILEISVEDKIKAVESALKG